ncbi:three component ABC system middle component [Brevundimonas sp.]|uniref:three component ABC system middle component n=1 Tax=Brevundimonas sp. TaxID=1871086 RepID=UPI00356685D3
MKIDHEELLARNPALVASAFWHLAHRHASSARGEPPTLPVFVVSAALLLHRATVNKIHAMNFESGMLKAVVERPDLLAGLQGRVEAHADTALRALQVGVSSGLLIREGGEGFPRFRATSGNDLPQPIRDLDAPVSYVLGAAKRLGTWFAADGFEAVQRQLNIEF